MKKRRRSGRRATDLFRRHQTVEPLDQQQRRGQGDRLRRLRRAAELHRHATTRRSGTQRVHRLGFCLFVLELWERGRVSSAYATRLGKRHAHTHTHERGFRDSPRVSLDGYREKRRSKPVLLKVSGAAPSSAPLNTCALSPRSVFFCRSVKGGRVYRQIKRLHSLRMRPLSGLLSESPRRRTRTRPTSGPPDSSCSSARSAATPTRARSPPASAWRR